MNSRWSAQRAHRRRRLVQSALVFVLLPLQTGLVHADAIQRTDVARRSFNRRKPLIQQARQFVRVEPHELPNEKRLKNPAVDVADKMLDAGGPMIREEHITQLQKQGVSIPFPEMVAIADDVKIEAIRGPNTVLHPGTYLQGSELQISAGCILGSEGPATVRNCALGEDVALKGGFFDGAVFLKGANMGLGAHIRPGTLLEEEANGAHTVGLKQTILLPFVTLGSLINFCDILMAGGTSRKDHSEVGSSFIHFNFTPSGKSGDKATASLIGDVPRGVMLRSPRIFLGGQAGLVGPLSMDYGTVLAAGFVYRQDHGPDELVVGESLQPAVLPFNPLRINRIAVKVERNVRYIGNLAALWQWYEYVRLPHAATDPQRQTVYRAGQQLVKKAIKERIKQLGRIAGYMDDSIAQLEQRGAGRSREAKAQRAFADGWPKMETELNGCCDHEGDASAREVLVSAMSNTDQRGYVAAVQSLPDRAVSAGTRWLSSIVDLTSETPSLFS